MKRLICESRLTVFSGVSYNWGWDFATTSKDSLWLSKRI